MTKTCNLDFEATVQSSRWHHMDDGELDGGAMDERGPGNLMLDVKCCDLDECTMESSMDDEALVLSFCYLNLFNSYG